MYAKAILHVAGQKRYAEAVADQGQAFASLVEYACNEYAGLVAPAVRMLLEQAGATTRETAITHERLRAALDMWFTACSKGISARSYYDIFRPYSPTVPFGEVVHRIEAGETHDDHGAIDALIRAVFGGVDAELCSLDGRYWVTQQAGAS